MFAVLRHVPFRNLWLGQAISEAGNAFYFVTFMFMAGKLTNSNATVGYVGAAETLPFLLLGPYAGVAADRFDRRQIMLLSDLGSALALLLFGLCVLFGVAGSVPVLLGIAFALSAVRVFFNPAKTAAIPDLAPAEDLVAANALSSATRNFMQMAGLGASAGILAALYALAPTGFFLGAVLVNALSFLGSAYYVWRLPILMPPPKEPAHPWTEFAQGLSYVKGRRDLVVLIVLLALFRLFVAPFWVFYYAANQDWFGGRPSTLAFFEFAFVVGMVSGSALMGRAKPKRPAIWFVVGLGLSGLPVVAMAYTRDLFAFSLCNFVCGVLIPVGDIPLTTYLQQSVPSEYRGRVSSVEGTFATGVMPIGMGLGGRLQESIGTLFGFVLIGLGMTVSCLLGLLDRTFRRIRLDPSEI
jgi:MFS family permease